MKGYEKLRFLLQKSHPCMNPRRLSHYASKSVVGGLTSRGEPEKRNSWTPMNNVSPLTQGLRYRTACDELMMFIMFAQAFGVCCRPMMMTMQHLCTVTELI